MKITRERHNAGVERLNKLFMLDEAHREKQAAFFARKAAEKTRSRRRSK